MECRKETRLEYSIGPFKPSTPLSKSKGHAMHRPTKIFFIVSGCLIGRTILNYIRNSPSEITPEQTSARKLLYDAVKNSDDYDKHGLLFQKKAQELVDSGRCDWSEFKENGGWIRSSDNPGFYFTFCGGLHRTNRVYLYPKTGHVSFGSPVISIKAD